MRDNEQKSDAVARVLVEEALGGRAGLGRVLDVGCGNGAILLACTRTSSEMTGVDINTVLLDRAATAVPSASFSRQSIEEGKLPFDDGTFDTIFFCDVIEHLRSPFMACKELRRLLAAGGRLLITTPNAGSVVRRLRGAAWFGLQDPSHIYFFDAFTLPHLLRQSGCRVDAVSSRAFTGNAIADRLLEATQNGGTLTVLAST